MRSSTIREQRLRQELDELRRRVAELERERERFGGGSARGRSEAERLEKAIAIVETVGVILFRLDGAMVDTNAAFVRMAGYRREELLQTHWGVLTAPDFMEQTRRAAAELASAGQTAPYEKQFVRKDGTRWWGLCAPKRVGGTGSGSECIEFIIDVTESKRSEEALRESETRLRALFDSMDEGFVIKEAIPDETGRPADYRYIECNPAFMRQTGLDDPTGYTVRELMPDIEPIWLENYDYVLRTGQPARFEAHMGPLNRWLGVSVSRLGGPGSRRVAIVFSDISERRRRESNLAFLADMADESSRLWSAAEIMRAVARKVGAYLNLANCLFIEIDEAQDEAIVEYSWSAADAQPVGLVGVHRLSGFITEEFRRAARGAETIVIRDTQADPRTTGGRYAAFNIRACATAPFHRHGEWKYAFTVCDSRPRDWRDDETDLVREVTYRIFPRLERARAEEALRASEQRFRSLFENSTDGVFLTMTDGRIIAANPAACSMFGMTEEEIRGAGRAGLIDPEDSRLAPMVEERRFTGRTRGELTYIRKDGSKFQGETSSAIAGEGGQAFVMVRDITDRKRDEDALRASEARERARAAELEAILQAAPVAMLIARDPECRNIIGSRMTYEMLRLPPGANVSKTAPEGEAPTNFRIMRDGREIPAQDLPPQKAAATGQPVRNYEFDLVFDDGTTLNVLGGAVPLLDEQGRPRGSVSAFLDLTERKRNEERFRQAQKLESIGLLAGGIAHDFNNLLTGILGNASMVLDEVSGATADRLREVIGSAERAANLTRQLLAYSGKGQFVVRDIRIPEVLHEIGGLVEFSIPRSVNLALNVQGRLPCVRMDPGQLQQVLMNLVINAGEAIGEGNPGQITVATSMTNVERTFVDATGEELAPGRYVVIEVSDTGRGIDEQTMPKIFDPFFTTKFTGRGLGLAAVAGILRSQKGGITVESAEGRGSTFRAFLPPAEEPPAAVEMAPGGLRRGTILVVDDEASVRDFITAVLRHRGYRVLAASDGREALAVCDREKGGIDAVVLDVVMPVMGANEVLHELKQRAPNARILLTSGYSEFEARRLCAAHPDTSFIQKPYTARQIASAVEELVGSV